MVTKRFGVGVAVATSLVGLAVAPAGLRDIGVRGGDGDLFILASAAAKSAPAQPEPHESLAQEAAQGLSPFVNSSLVNLSPLDALAADGDNFELRTPAAATGARKEKTARVAALPAAAPASPRKPARRLALAPGQTGCVRCVGAVASRTWSGRARTPLVAILSKSLMHKGPRARMAHNPARQPRGASPVVVAASFPPAWFREKL